MQIIEDGPFQVQIPDDAVFKKSWYSGDANCLYVYFARDKGLVILRNSTTGGHLILQESEWYAFQMGVKRDEFGG